MGRPLAATLDIVALSVHLKLKYHNLQGESAIINADLEGEKRIYQALQKVQGEGIAMEINVASLTGKLNKMGVCPQKSG